ncbi:glycosyl transferase [Arthrobacter sp. I2-34]|uniref:Glycosyl transferase n=1 Tax=Arthrobacter hankyongi TaxID=2904801 RepID=A0ABS9L854_9MICC|nr:macrolide family glycosyltransferase [Arthrobacter hankyongi]MCG2622854.1 glycosyl transferase [Arthrobacter hankyongi]
MDRRHIAMVGIPAPGHVNPGLEVIRELAARGHRVSYANDPSFRGIIEATGAGFVPYRSTLPRLGGDGKPDGGPESGGASWDGDVIDQLSIFQRDYEAMLPQLRAAFDADRPDLFLYDIAAGPARILAMQWELPAIQLSPTYVAWEGYEEDMRGFTDGLKADPRGRAYFDWQAAFLAGEGIGMDPAEFFGRPPRAVVLIPEVLQPNADRVNREVYTFTGPALAAATGQWQRPAAAEHVLLVSLGSAFTDRPEFYRSCIEAYGNLPGWHVVLQIGRYVDPAVLGPVPANIEIHPWVPQLRILEQADAFLTHAGMGGASEGLFTGTPMIAAPQAVDQFDNADALVAAGVAVRIESAAADADLLRRALAEVRSPQVVARCAGLAARLRAAGRAA